MSILRFAFGMAFLATVLSGCSGLDIAPRRSAIQLASAPTHYYTALEAYERIRPDMLSWHEDAIVGGVRAVLGSEAPQWGMQADDRAPWWVFIVSSPKALSYTEIHLVDSQIIVGFEGIPGYEKPTTGNAAPLALDELVDSDRALAVARKNGAVGVPVYMSLNTYDRKARRDIPLSWMIYYEPPEGGILDVYIDAHTGEVVDNEFSGK